MRKKVPTNRDRLLASLALITVAATWGIAAPVVKLTLQEIPPFTFLFFRFLIATITIIPIYALHQEKRRLTSKDILTISGIGFLGMTLTIGLIFYGLQFTTATDQVLIGLLGPLFVVIGGGIFLREEITTMEKAGLIAALTGSVITVVQPILERGIAGSEALFGNAIIFLSSATFAAYALLAKKVSRKYSPMLMTTVPTGVSVICFTPLFIIEYLNNPAVMENLFTPLAIFGILYMALLSYVLAYLLYQWGLSKIEASEAAVFGYLNPVFAFPVAYIFLGERLTVYLVIGAILIGTGVLLTEYKPHG